jgi:hypothetical protein
MDLKRHETLWGLDSAGLGQGLVARSCKHMKELIGSLRGEEFFD